MKTRAEVDEEIWAMHRSIPPEPLPSPPLRYSVVDFEQLAHMYLSDTDIPGLLDTAWQSAFAHFLTAFFTYKQPSFFSQCPPASLPIERQAFLAGATEVLCARFDHLVAPEWVHDPGLVLPELWDPNEAIMCMFPMELRLARAHPLFLRHNVIAEERNLLCV
jgi:hypothetical protein